MGRSFTAPPLSDMSGDQSPFIGPLSELLPEQVPCSMLCCSISLEQGRLLLQAQEGDSQMGLEKR